MNIDDIIQREHNWNTRLSQTLNEFRLLAPKLQQLEQSDTASCNLSGGINFWVYNREDLQVVLSLAPTWEKRYSEESDFITYEAKSNNVSIYIYAKEAALPKTCKLIEVTVVIPAVPAIPAQPARTETRMQLQCTFSDAADTAS